MFNSCCRVISRNPQQDWTPADHSQGVGRHDGRSEAALYHTGWDRKQAATFRGGKEKESGLASFWNKETGWFTII